MLRMCLNAVYIFYIYIYIYLISELFNVFCLFILSVMFCYGLFMYCSSVLCGLNQGIAAKEPCAPSIRFEERRVGERCALPILCFGYLFCLLCFVMVCLCIVLLYYVASIRALLQKSPVLSQFLPEYADVPPFVQIGRAHV